MVESPEESLQRTLTSLKELGYLDDDAILVEGDRLHSGLTDLRVHETGHVVRRAEEGPGGPRPRRATCEPASVVVIRSRPRPLAQPGPAPPWYLPRME